MAEKNCRTQKGPFGDNISKPPARRTCIHTVHLLLKHRQPRLVSKLRGLVKSFGVETSGSVAKCRLFSQASCVAAITKTERRPGHIDDSIRVACFGYWEMAIEQWHLGILGTNNSFLAPTSQCSKQPFLAQLFSETEPRYFIYDAWHLSVLCLGSLDCLGLLHCSVTWVA